MTWYWRNEKIFSLTISTSSLFIALIFLFLEFFSLQTTWYIWNNFSRLSQIFVNYAKNIFPTNFFYGKFSSTIGIFFVISTEYWYLNLMKWNQKQKKRTAKKLTTFFLFYRKLALMISSFIKMNEKFYVVFHCFYYYYCERNTNNKE